jgi:hypothetical protein
MSEVDHHFHVMPAKAPQMDVLIYEFGVRLDAASREAVAAQIAQARHLYNEIVACMRATVEALHAFVLDRAGAPAQALLHRVNELNAAFAAARAASDDDRMRAVAAERRAAWRELSPLLREARIQHTADIRSRFLSRIGNKSSCETYAIRCRAVANGLGWATANAVLDAALLAFKRSFMLGRAPRFAVGADKSQDTLTLQFTAAGGIAASRLLQGDHTELALRAPQGGAGRRRYGEFSFRLGAAAAKTYAHGTWQYHRPIPMGAQISAARLIRRRVGKDDKYALQLVVRLPGPATMQPAPQRKPLAAVHFGWAADVSGRRIASIADCPDPGAARLIQLPSSIESMLERASAFQAERDTARDAIVPQIKAYAFGALPEDLASELAAIRRLPVQHVAVRRLHRLSGSLNRAGVIVPDWLGRWRKEDRLLWQASAHLARRARNARKNFYRNLAASLARGYTAIAIEPLDLAEAAMKIDESTGERTEFSRKARSGRVVAALYELESAIRWAATKAGTAVLELTGKTARTCSLCGGSLSGDGQELTCQDCGAIVDRKCNGAAVAWQAAHGQFEDAVADYWSEAIRSQEQRHATHAAKKQRMADGRRAARASRQEPAGEV